MSLDPVRVSARELLILQALAGGRRPAVTSKHRMRLELLGLARDGPAGLQLTPEGHRRAQGTAAAVVELEKATPRHSHPLPRDARGRRRRGRHTQPA